MEEPQSSEKFQIATVVLDLGFNKPLDYLIPESLQSTLKKGMQVEVPMRNKLYKGIVTGCKKSSSFTKLSKISSIIDPTPLLDPILFEFALWLSCYYATDLNRVLQTMLPATIRKSGSHKEQLLVRRLISKSACQEMCISLRQTFPAQAKVLELLLTSKEGILLSELLEKAEISKSPITTLEKRGVLSLTRMAIERSALIGEEYFRCEKKRLNAEQQSALETIILSIESKTFQTHLLYGITGSGKTEIYLQAIEHALEKGLSTLVLVPEIALTTQMIERFRSRFEGKIAIFHHRLNDGERYDEWHRIREKKVQIVIGARSAIFTPIKDLGLIIVDEEHENAYKQEEGFRYHGRDIAVMRAKLSNACIVLGSATPSLESMHNATLGKYKLLRLSKRVENANLPTLILVDMKKEKERNQSLFSELLIDKIKKRLSLGEQTILFLNRRGYHTTLLCSECRYVYKCPSCDLPLTFHRGENHLSCHLCDYRESTLPSSCPDCTSSQTLKYQGIGTEKLEAAVHALFPEARTLRIDSDTTRHKGSLEKYFRTFRTQKADILIGTQMIAKGLDFPAVTLVALLAADQGLQIPDFRASERVFQLITQVAGRSGRGALPGEVVVQSYLAENSTITSACHQDFDRFFNQEMEIRRCFSFPPFGHLVKVLFTGPHQKAVQEQALLARSRLIDLLPKEWLVHPVTPSGHAKVRDQFRFQFIVRGKNTPIVCQAIQKISTPSPSKENGVKMIIDVDPISTFF